MSDKVLILDDEEFIREEVAECLLDYGYVCVEAACGLDALKALQEDKAIAIVLVDIRMPGMSGLEMIAKARDEICVDRDIEFIVVTGHGATGEAIDALQKGVMDFLQKPVDFMKLIDVVDQAQALVNKKRNQRFYDDRIQHDAQIKTIELQRLCGKIDSISEDFMTCLATAAEYKDPETGQHIQRLGQYATFVAKKLAWSAERQQKILLAAPLHDIGKIGVPDHILLKEGPLTVSEWRVMVQHAEMGYDILKQSEQPVIQMAANIALGHHERWDGSGYPLGLKGHAISMESRITSLVDVYDALRSKRTYKPALTHEQATAIILKGDGRTQPTHFDPQVLAVFKQNGDDFHQIFCCEI